MRSSNHGEPAATPPPKVPSPTELHRREQILDGAIDVLAEDGWAGASVARIARRAGVSTGVVPYYFGAKDSLMQAVLEAVYRRGAEFMIPRIAAEPTPRGQLRTYLEANVAFMAAAPRQVLATVEIATHFTPRDIESWQRGEEPILAPLDELLGRGQQDGSFRADFAPRTISHAIRRTIDGIPPRIRLEPDLDLDRLGTELADLFDHATRRTDA